MSAPTPVGSTPCRAFPLPRGGGTLETFRRSMLDAFVRPRAAAPMGAVPAGQPEAFFFKRGRGKKGGKREGKGARGSRREGSERSERSEKRREEKTAPTPGGADAAADEDAAPGLSAAAAEGGRGRGRRVHVAQWRRRGAAGDRRVAGACSRGCDGATACAGDRRVAGGGNQFCCGEWGA